MSSQGQAPAQRMDKKPLPPPPRFRLGAAHPASTRRTPGDSDFIFFPIELGQFFTESKNELEQLREVHPWLHELDKDNEVDFRSLRQAFLTDGHTFMSALGKFLNAKKWQEFVITYALHRTFDPIANPAA